MNCWKMFIGKKVTNVANIKTNCIIYTIGINKNKNKNISIKYLYFDENCFQLPSALLLTFISWIYTAILDKGIDILCFNLEIKKNW